MKETKNTLPNWFNGTVYEELSDEKREELIDSGDYYEEKED